jgi:hypothetical protein
MNKTLDHVLDFMGSFAKLLDYGYSNGAYLALYRTNESNKLYSICAESYTNVWILSTAPDCLTAQEAFSFHSFRTTLIF